MRWLRPFSSTITDHPAPVSTSATVDPPGPEPTMTASQSSSAATGDLRLVAAGHLVVGVAARLDVTDPPDRVPSREVAVAAVHRIAVHAFAGVLVEQSFEARIAVEQSVLLLRSDGREVTAERRETVSIPLLEPDDRTVELPLGPTPRARESGAPRQFLHGPERQPRCERRLTSPAAGERSARVDAGWVEGE